MAEKDDFTPDDFTPDDGAPTTTAASSPVRRPMNVAAHPLVGMLQNTGITPQNIVPMITPTASVLGGALGYRVGGARGAAFGGGVTAGLGRIGERGLRSAMGMPPPQSITEMIGGQSVVDNLPPDLRTFIDLAEQTSIGALMEGVPSALLGAPGRGAKPSAWSLDQRRPQTRPGWVQRKMREAMDRDLENIEKQAIGKRREVIEKGRKTPQEVAAVADERAAFARDRTQRRLAARDIGPEIAEASKVTRGARGQAGAKLGRAVDEATEGGVTIDIDDIVARVMDRQKSQFGRAASPEIVSRRVRSAMRGIVDRYTVGAVRLPSGSSKLVDASGRPLPPPPIVLSAKDAQTIKRALAEKLESSLAATVKGKKLKGGPVTFTEQALKDVLDEVVPGLPEANVAASAAIRASRGVEELAARQPVEAVRRLRETQAVRGAESSARSGMRLRPVEDAVRQAQAERQAAAAARANWLTASPWNPEIYLSGGVRATTPSLGGARLGLSRAVEHPVVSGSLRYSPAVTNFLIRMLLSNTNAGNGAGAPFDDGTMPPDTLRNDEH